MSKVTTTCAGCGTTFLLWPSRMVNAVEVFCKRSCMYDKRRRDGYITPPNFVDLTGRTFGRWTVIERVIKKKWEAYWLCQCSCGTNRAVLSASLTRGLTKSCGCLASEMQIARNTTHGHNRTKEYTTWQRMIGRCTNPKNNSFERYGARGITVCDRWRHSFMAFLEDVGYAPSTEYSLDRIDNNGNYEPRNVRWATAAEQARNRRSSRLVTHDGRTMTIAEWSEATGVTQHTICGRLGMGWPMERILSEPVHHR